MWEEQCVRFSTFKGRRWRDRLTCLALGFTFLALNSLSWAGRLESLQYEDGWLTLQSLGEIPRPVLEVWAGQPEPNPTQLIMLSCPGVEADVQALQAKANQLLLENPGWQRILVGHLEDNSARRQPVGFQLVVEVKLPRAAQAPNQRAKSAALQAPTLTLNHQKQWQLSLPSPQMAITPTTELKAEAPPATLPPFLESQQVQPPKSVPRNQTSSQSQIKKASTQPKIAQTTKEAKAAGEVPALTSATAALNGELQALREGNGALEKQVRQLQQALQQAEKERDELQVRLNQYEDQIRVYDPKLGGAGARDAVTIQNLRNALVKVAGKLKATEAALEAQGAKTRSFAVELAHLKQTPALLNDPTLLVQVAEPMEKAPATPVAPKAANTTTVYASASPAPALPPKALKQFQYTPPRPKGVNFRQTTDQSQILLLEAEIREKPAQYPLYLTLADLYVAHGQIQNAEATLTRLLKVNPGYGPGYYYLAWVYLHQKRALEAQVALATFKRLNSGDRDSIQALQEAIQVATPSVSQIKR